jgi:hypothetical protein
MNLSRYLFSLTTTLILSGCNTVDLWYRAGVPPEKPGIDLANCQIYGTRNIPVNMVTKQTPIKYIPGETVCSIKKDTVTCTESGGYTTGGKLYTEDINNDARNKFIIQCMQQNAYEYIRLPKCSKAKIPSELPSYETLPLLNSDACLIPVNNDRYLVFNP